MLPALLPAPWRALISGLAISLPLSLTADPLILTAPPVSYGGPRHDKPSTGPVTLDSDNLGFTVTGNRWLKIPFDYTITPHTVLEVEALISTQGEIHAIGLENNNRVRRGRKRLFQLHGTHLMRRMHQLEDSQRYSGSGWQTFAIPIGQYYTGSANSIAFANDHDAAPHNATAHYRNIRVYELQPSETPRPDLYTGYASLDTPSDGTILTETDPPPAIGFSGSRWIKIPFPYTVLPETVLEFTFGSDLQGELHAIGLDEDEIYDNAARLFQIHGTSAGIPGTIPLAPAETYGNFAPNFQAYSIPVGQHYTGDIGYLVIANTSPTGFSATSLFQDIHIFEPAPAPLAPTPEDTDADGLLDTWEQTLIANSPPGTYTGIEDVLPGADPDADGEPNSVESRTGTDPLDATSSMFGLTCLTPLR